MLANIGTLYDHARPDSGVGLNATRVIWYMYKDRGGGKGLSSGKVRRPLRLHGSS